MPGKRITIIPRIHGKLTRDRKMSEPDIYWIPEKGLERQNRNERLHDALATKLADEEAPAS